ncbi:MAG: YitT family protein [Blautia sp.]|nr:YitT family protein [Blautia sp.]
MEKIARNPALRLVVMIACSFLTAVNIKTFVRAGNLFPGGATGLTLLIQQIFIRYLNMELPYSLINVILNAIPVYIGFRYIGKKFTLYSCLVIVLTGFFTDLIPSHFVTDDILLVSVFGGIINGFIVSVVLMSGATTGGTDFIGIFLSDKKGIDSFHIILGINAVILTVAGLLFGWDRALYSIIYQYTTTIILHSLYRKYQQGTLFIVTNKPREICEAISSVSHHGATILEGEGSYDHTERSMVYSVVSSAEAHKVISAVRSVDPKAFINLLKTQEISGRFYRRRED